MEFKTCPSCKASVLEDDADNCPFCGASMTGRPTPTAPAKPATEARTQTATPKSAPAADKTAPQPASGPARRRTKAAPAVDDGGDPFEVDTRAVQKAIPVSRKPTKGHMHRVVCPMCETPGFIATGHAGKEVKCCNPECLVPIFTAPLPEQPKEEEPEPNHGMSGLAFTVVAIVLVGGVGAALWYFVLNGKDAGQVDRIADVTTVQPTGQNGGGNTDVTDDGSGTETIVEPALPPVPLSEVKATCLQEIVHVARQRQNNRSKPYDRQLCAEAFAEVGQLPEAVAQIDAMRNVDGYEEFCEVEPWVSIALARLETGDRDGANAALDEALAKADFPIAGRAPLDAAGALAGALAFAGRTDEAKQVARHDTSAELRGRLSTLWRGAIDGAAFEIQTASDRPDLSSMPSPQWVTVTRFLVFQGDTQAALAWARSAPTVSARDNAIAVWAAELVLLATTADDANTLAQVEQVAASLDPAGKARVWAAVSHAQRQRGAADAASKSLTTASNAAANLTVPTEVRPLPALKDIYASENSANAGLPEETEYVDGALAFMDLAQLNAALGQPEQAWSYVQSALSLLRGATPGPEATAELVDQCDRDADAVKRRLKAALEIDEDRAFLAFNQYRNQCRILNEQAALRYQVQVELLRRAVGWGLGPQVWVEIQSRNGEPDSNDREPYFQTSLPGMIAFRADKSGDKELAKSVTAALAPAPVRLEARDRMEVEFAAALEAGDLAQEEAALESYRMRAGQDPYPMYLIALQAVSRLIAEDRHSDAFDLAQRIPYPLTREDAYWLIAAAAVRDGRHSEIWRRDRDQLSATELAALYRGFIDGLPFAPSDEQDESSEVARTTE